MKRSIYVMLMAFALSVTMPSCSSVSPNGDEEAVLIKKPWFFGHGGVSNDPVTSGLEWCAISTDNVKFKITPIRFDEEFPNLATKGNNFLQNLSVYVTLKIKKGKTPELYEGFGEKWYESNLQAPIRTIIRDKASSHSIFEISSNREVLAKMEAFIKEQTITLITKKQMPVDVEDVSIGEVKPPQDIIDETNKTAAQYQAKVTQDARADAELSRKQAEQNKADSDKAYQEKMNMTVDQYMHMRQLEISKEQVELIKNNPKVTMIFGNSVPMTYPVK